jgi:hypothetical protein
MNAKKTISILFGSLLTFLSSQIVAKEVENFYINGIDNTRKQANDSASELTRIFTEKYGHIIVNTEVVPIYNESQGKFIDLVESGLQKTDLDKLLEGLTGLGLMTSAKAIEIITNISDVYEKEIFVKMIHQHMLMSDSAYRFELYGSIEYVDNSANILLTGPGSLDPSSYDIIEELRTFDELAFLLDLGVTSTELISLKAINGLSGYFNDVATETQQAYESQGYYTTQEYISQQKIRTELDEVLDIGGAVNIVAHSQGNFFANEVLTNIDQPDNTRLLSVGSPSGDLPATGNYVNLREDMVVRGTKPNLGWNYSNISDNYWNNSINVATSFNKIVVNEFNLSLENDNVNADKKGHNLVTAYLKDGSAARERIIDALAEQYIALGV